MLSRLKKSAGFTIVEVMIVLAIAGVIMAVVFLAVPQLQHSSRDSQREAVVENIHSELETYAANNTGKYPFNKGTVTDCSSTTSSGNWDDFYCNYIAKITPGGTTEYKNDKDPATQTSIFGATPLQYRPVQCAPAGSTGTDCATSVLSTSTGQGQVIVHAKCKGASPISSDGKTDAANATVTTRDYAVVIMLEQGNAVFCVDNS